MEYKCDGKQKVVGKTQIEKNHKIHKDRNRLYISRKQTNQNRLVCFFEWIQWVAQACFSWLLCINSMYQNDRKIHAN